jgi:hypothetical protein
MARRSYTSKKRPTVTFDLDGVEFVVSSGVSMLDVMELAKYADTEMNTTTGIAAVADFFRRLLGDGYDRFRQHCSEHHTDEETLMQVMGDLIEDVSGHPTQRPSVSADGPPTTAPTLKVISSDGVTERPLTTEELEQWSEAQAG